MVNEKKAMFSIDIIFNIIGVYFSTFFVFYFLNVANNNIVPLTKFYFTLYFFNGFSFFLIRNAMKRNIKVPFFRIGISLMALYIALIMILKEKIIDFVYVVAIVRGLAGGMFYFPKNILGTEKISNEGRQKYDGLLNTINKIVSILIPLALGILLTYFNYVSLAKVFFILFIVMFLCTFYLHDTEYYPKRKVEMKKFIKMIKDNKKLRYSLWSPFLAGFTYSAGIMGLIVTFSKIYVFKTNLNLGFVDSTCAGLSLLVCYLYTKTIKEKHFQKTLLISGIISMITLLIFSIYPGSFSLITYLLVSSSCITIISLITTTMTVNYSNSKEFAKEFKAEYYLVRELLFTISRCLGYLLLFFVCHFINNEYVNYLMIIPAIAVFMEALIISKLAKE